MNNEQPSYPYEPEFSFKKLLSDRADDVKYVFQFKKSMAAVLLVAGCLGALVAYKWPVTYTARLTFVIDDAIGYRWRWSFQTGFSRQRY